MGAAVAKNDGVATVERMKKMPAGDDCVGKITIRAGGRHLTLAHLFEVKKPESRGPWNSHKTLVEFPAAVAFRPLAGGTLPVHQGMTGCGPGETRKQP